MSYLPPAWLIGAQALDHTGDLHLAPGAHFRVVTHPLAGLPLRPLLVYRANLGQSAKNAVLRQDITWTDGDGAIVPTPFTLIKGKPVYGWLPVGANTRCVWIKPVYEAAKTLRMDAFIHALGAYTNAQVNPIGDLCAQEAIRLVTRHLPRAIEDGADLAARSGMMFASHLAGIAISMKGNDAIHGLSTAVESMIDCTHGESLSALMPHVLHFNRDAVASRYANIARLMGLPVGRTKIIVYAFSGFCSALAGIVFSISLLAGYGQFATGLELDTIASVVMGGTLLTGGVGNVLGSLFGVLIEGTIISILQYNGTLSSWWTRIGVGVLTATSIISVKEIGFVPPGNNKGINISVIVGICKSGPIEGAAIRNNRIIYHRRKGAISIVKV